MKEACGHQQWDCVRVGFQPNIFPFKYPSSLLFWYLWQDKCVNSWVKAKLEWLLGQNVVNYRHSQAFSIVSWRKLHNARNTCVGANTDFCKQKGTWLSLILSPTADVQLPLYVVPRVLGEVGKFCSTEDSFSVSEISRRSKLIFFPPPWPQKPSTSKHMSSRFCALIV